MLTAEQKEIRKNYIGGSDAAAIAGMSKYTTPLDVYLDKLGLVEEKEETQPMYWGKRLEQVIVDEYARATGHKVEQIDSQYSKEYPFMIANVDGYIPGENVVVECKNVNAFRASQFGPTGTDEMPTEFILQCAHYAIVTNCKRVDLAVLLGGNDFRIYQYNRNERLERQLIALERNFWENHVVPRNPPEPVCYRDVLNLWPKSDDKTLTATAQMMSSLDMLRETRMGIKKLEDEEEKYKVEITKLLGDASVLVDAEGNKLATWKTGKTSRTFRLA